MNNLLPSVTCVACHCSDTMQQPTSTSNILNYTQSFGAIHNNLLTLYGETFPDLIGTHEQIWQFMTTETTKELNTVNLPGANFISFSDANSYGVNIKSSLNLFLKALQSQGIISPTIYELVDTILFIIKNFENSTDVSFRLNSFINKHSLNPFLTQNDKISVLGAANVGLYSNYFWDFALNNSDDPYHQIAFDLNATGNLYKIKWADLIGFVVGAGVGIAAGPLTAVSTGIALGGFASKIFGE